MTISIITAVYNDKKFIPDAVRSVLTQTYPHIEYIIIDGGSADGTVDIINNISHQSSYIHKVSKFVSEKDNGMYDALNKGINLASGDVIGFLHSDDMFADETVIEKIAGKFESADVEIVYSDLEYISRNNREKIIRYWEAGEYSQSSLKYGWMPPHPSLFAKKSLYDRTGLFDTGLKIASDYDMMLRLLKNFNGSVCYINKVLVKMRQGGKSNSGLTAIINKSREDYRTLKKNNFPFPAGTLFLKNIRKLNQFI